jgi:hypothetical protein
VALALFTHLLSFQYVRGLNVPVTSDTLPDVSWLYMPMALHMVFMAWFFWSNELGGWQLLVVAYGTLGATRWFAGMRVRVAGQEDAHEIPPFLPVLPEATKDHGQPRYKF